MATILKKTIIKNRAQLATSGLRRKALDIIEAGITRVLPSSIMKSAVSFDRNSCNLCVNNDIYKINGRLFVIGGGKASGLMAQTLEAIIGKGIITDGLIIEKANPEEFLTADIKIVQAGHPVPDRRGVEAMERMLGLKQKYGIDQSDLILCLISGGGSSLMPSPMDGISLKDKQVVTQLLLSCGANIFEINSVRKHLSKTKGGKLAQHFAPTRVVSVILSDVIGNDLSVIASGPTHPDQSTFGEAYTIVKKFHLLEKIPSNVKSLLEQGTRGELPETPKSMNNVRNYIIGDINIALKAMLDKSLDLGFRPFVISAEQLGDTEQIACQRAREILGGKYSGYNALIIGGETTPTLPGKPGKGGRNQHYVAVSMQQLECLSQDWVIASIGTDGSDFMPDIAGAIGDIDSFQTIKSKSPDYYSSLKNYDSNTLLANAENTLVITGNTHTNVGDIMLYLFKDAPDHKLG